MYIIGEGTYERALMILTRKFKRIDEERKRERQGWLACSSSPHLFETKIRPQKMNMIYLCVAYAITAFGNCTTRYKFKQDLPFSVSVLSIALHNDKLIINRTYARAVIPTHLWPPPELPTTIGKRV